MNNRPVAKSLKEITTEIKFDVRELRMTTARTKEIKMKSKWKILTQEEKKQIYVRMFYAKKDHSDSEKCTIVRTKN